MKTFGVASIIFKFNYILFIYTLCLSSSFCSFE